MSSSIVAFVQPITQPLEGLYTNFSQLAARHRDANQQLYSHTNELLSGSSQAFKGSGAAGFSNLVSYYLDLSEKHMQVLDDAANTVNTCHSDITNATNHAASAGLHQGLVNHVLKSVTHDEVIQQGSDVIWMVVNTIMNTLNSMKNAAGSFFGDLFSFHFSDALGDLGKEFSDVGQLVGDVTGLLTDIGNVLGSWASTISNAVGKCLSFIGSAALKVVDFVTGFSSIINDVKTIFNGKASIWDKLLAGGDLILNVGMDVSMLFGVGEALRGGELLLKGGVDLVEKLGENGGKDILVNLFKGDGTKLLEKVSNLEGDKVFQSLDPALQDVMKQTKQITSDSVKRLADLTDQALKKGDKPLEEAIQGFENLGPKTRKYLQRITRTPMAKTWKMAYGYAVQELTQKEMEKAGLDKLFNLTFDQAAPDGLKWLSSKTPATARPDVLMDLGKDTYNIFDWTAEKSSGKILKYTSNGVEYLIEYLYKHPILP